MRKSTKAGVVAGTVLALTGGGVAFAYWTTSGNGTGSAGTSTGVSNLTITQTAAPTNLFPGQAPQAIAGTVTNNADQNAFVNTVTVSIHDVQPLAGQTCDASNYTIANGTMNVGTDLAKGGSANFSGATIQFVNDPKNSQDGCKGATVNLAYASN